MSAPHVSIPVGVIVERSKSASQWADFYWRPAGVLTGVPDTPAWSKLSDDGERTQFYAGATDIKLFRTETAQYRDNVTLETPLLWIVVIVRAVRNFPHPPQPGAHSSSHIFWAWLATVEMAMTALTGWIFYWLAFVA